jgi:transcriptional regulator of acetoin/glycerol metabolism
VERAVVLSEGAILRAGDMLEFLRTTARLEGPGACATGQATDACVSERERIVEVLAACGGNQGRAAKLLGLSRNTLIARLKKYDVARPLGPRRRD